MQKCFLLHVNLYEFLQTWKLYWEIFNYFLVGCVEWHILTAGEYQYRNNYHLYPVMANTFRAGDPRGFNKGCSSKFHVGSWVQQTPEEGQRTYRLKRCGNIKDKDNSPKTFNDKNHQTSSKKFRQLNLRMLYIVYSFKVFFSVQSKVCWW